MKTSRIADEDSVSKEIKYIHTYIHSFWCSGSRQTLSLFGFLTITILLFNGAGLVTVTMIPVLSSRSIFCVSSCFTDIGDTMPLKCKFIDTKVVVFIKGSSCLLQFREVGISEWFEMSFEFFYLEWA